MHPKLKIIKGDLQVAGGFEKGNQMAFNSKKLPH